MKLISGRDDIGVDGMQNLGSSIDGVLAQWFRVLCATTVLPNLWQLAGEWIVGAVLNGSLCVRP